MECTTPMMLVTFDFQERKRSSEMSRQAMTFFPPSYVEKHFGSRSIQLPDASRTELGDETGLAP
jgi:hypothetical protein